MRKILYNIKKTRVNTDYLEIEQPDMNVLQYNMLGILMYMSELTISKNKDVRDFIKWFNTTNKRYHYNSKLKRHNSPQSLLAGCMNNIQFGWQYNFTLLQLEVLQDVINTSIDIISAIETELDIKLQDKPLFEKIFIQENLWTNV